MFPRRGNMITEAFAHREQPKAPKAPTAPKVELPPHLKKARAHLFHALHALHGQSAPDVSPPSGMDEQAIADQESSMGGGPDQ